MPTIKELHYWDSVATGKWDFWVRDTAKKYQEHLDKAETDNPKKRARQLRMSSDTLAWLEVIEKKTRDDAAYVSFLNRRVKRASGWSVILRPLMAFCPRTGCGRWRRWGRTCASSISCGTRLPGCGRIAV